MIFILTGPVHSGKTTFLKSVINELKDQGVEIDGLLSETVLENQEVIGYDLFDIEKEEAIPYIRKEGEKNWQKVGSFYFTPQGLLRATEIIFGSKENALLIVDEAGPLELRRRGLWPALKEVIFQSSKKSVLVVRTSILEEFLCVLGKSEVKVFNVEDKEVFSRMIQEIT